MKALTHPFFSVVFPPRLTRARFEFPPACGAGFDNVGDSHLATPPSVAFGQGPGAVISNAVARPSIIPQQKEAA